MCEFCENKVDMGNKPIENRYGIDLMIDGSFLYAWCDCGRKVVKEIIFCPICGRKLEEEKELPWVTVGMEDDCK